jgi:hypothetical protein
MQAIAISPQINSRHLLAAASPLPTGAQATFAMQTVDIERTGPF